MINADMNWRIKSRTCIKKSISKGQFTLHQQMRSMATENLLSFVRSSCWSLLALLLFLAI